MSISMIGIDYERASVDIRAQFSFTKKNAVEVMERLKEEPDVFGCILLSTCNRMELWASTKDNWKGSLYQYLCREKQKDENTYRAYFTERTEEEAVRHLFYLTSGLKSQILAEDQILTQVKDALSLSRENYCTDSVLEVLFRMAVSAAKKVKTDVVFSRANHSVIDQAIRYLQEQGIALEEKNCMVIGNGEMGKTAAAALREAGAKVTVTVRQYRSGIVEIPHGCERIDYGKRIEFLPSCDLIVSATASPNYTLTKELIENAGLSSEKILIDLAVPRDIEPEVKNLPGITLYDIDSFRTNSSSEEILESMKQADEILQAQFDEFYSWYNGRDLMPKIRQIKEEAVHDLNLRIEKTLRKASLDEEERKLLLDTFDTAAEKVVNKMIFGLRDFLSEKEFMNCVEGLEKLYEKE